jgi:hypothetical protein
VTVPGVLVVSHRAGVLAASDIVAAVKMLAARKSLLFIGSRPLHLSSDQARRFLKLFLSWRRATPTRLAQKG